MEFYKNAVELRCALSGFVMQEKYIPKKWRPILAYPTVNLLNTMMEHIIAANGIYPYSGGKLTMSFCTAARNCRRRPWPTVRHCLIAYNSSWMSFIFPG